VRTNWPQFHRGSFRHGETPHENVLGPDNVAQLRLLWNVPSGLHIEFAIQGSPVVANGLVYFLTSDNEQGQLLVLDARTGARRWTKPLGARPWCGATPAVAQGRVYAPVAGRMAAYDARTGALRWRAGSSACAAPMTPTVGGTKLFTTTPASPNYVQARDTASGRLLWSRQMCFSLPDGGCFYGTSNGPIAAGDGIVYVTNGSGGMAAHDADTGRQLWSRVVGAGNFINTAPVVEGDVVYISVHDGRVHALNRLTGAELWSAPVGNYNHTTPALANGVLYVGSDTRGITAIDAKTGAVRWQQTAVGSVRTSPAVANGVLYLGAGDGRLLSPSPAVADGVVYVGTGDRLLAFGLRSSAAGADR
jgi:outer membrane protein assembly factor BamB